MPAILARLIVSLVFMLSLPVLYFIMLFVMFEVFNWREDEVAFTLATTVAVPFATLGWIALWAQEVRWHPMRIGMTAGVFGTSAGAGIFLGMFIGVMMRYDGVTVGMIFGSMIWALGWFGLTPLVWKETRGEREQRVSAVGADDLPCPTCGYNLNGLREAKCPECGAQYTLDQLYAHLREQAAPLERV